jgi:Ni2+-binding GTPase involved in maturation of urease and hydrogenase
MTDISHWKQYIGDHNVSVIENFIDKCKKNERSDYILVLHGSGNEGKTTLINEIIDIVGQTNCVHIPPVCGSQKEPKYFSYATEEIFNSVQTLPVCHPNASKHILTKKLGDNKN